MLLKEEVEATSFSFVGVGRGGVLGFSREGDGEVKGRGRA